MSVYARIENNEVMELLETEGNITEMFPSELVWVDITDVKPIPDQRWKYVDGVFSKPYVPPYDPTPEILAELLTLDKDSIALIRTILIEAKLGDESDSFMQLQAIHDRSLILNESL